MPPGGSGPGDEHARPGDGAVRRAQVHDAYDELVARSDPALVVVTVAAGEDDHGCLVGFHTQVSIEPRRHLVCLSHANATWTAAGGATHLGVQLLGPGDVALARRFGGTSAHDGVDKFDAVSWHRHPTGPPLLDVAAAWFIGAVVARHALGDHTGIVLDVVDAAATDSPFALHLGQVRDMEAGR